VQTTEPAPASEAPRPTGVALTALALAALVATYLIHGLLHLTGGPLTPAAVLEQLLVCFGGGAELLILWNYWRGQNWGRILILLWSFVVAARDISVLIDGNASLTSLMSHPLSFFRLLMAIFLLYWLNTQPVRAWFKKMSATAADLIADHLAGKLCTAVETSSGDLWRLSFEHDTELTLACPWRIVLDENLAFASTSAPAAGAVSGAAYPPAKCPPEPGDKEDEARRLLQNTRVKSVRVAPRTSDLFLTFEMGIELQTWSTDPHAHQWKFSDPLLTVTADAVNLSSQLIPPSPSQDSAAPTSPGPQDSND
jgi:hypothetical protein